MRVLSRRRNFAKAIACGYYEGAGFACSNGTLPCFCRPFRSTPSRPVDAALASCLPRAPRVCTLGCASGHTLSPVPVGSPSAGSRARCDVGAAATPRWRRRGVQGGAETVHSAVDHTQLGPSRPPTSSSKREARRRRRGGGDSSRHRRPGDGCRAVVSVTGPERHGTAGEQWAPAGAQLHKNRARLRRGLLA